MKITTDIAITINHKEILLISRKKSPFQDKFALPGGHLEESDESLRACCAREAEEEVNFKVHEDKLEKLTFLDHPKRDPRPGKRISTVFHVDVPDITYLKDCKAQSDAEAIHIVNIANLTKEQMAFDHWEVIEILKNKQS